MSKARAAAGSGGALVLAAVALVALVVLAVGAVAAVSPLGTAALLGLAVFAAAASLPVWLLPSVSLWLFALVPVGYLIGVPNYFARFWTPAVLVLAIWVVRIALHRGRGVFLRSLRWTLPLAVLLLALSVVSLSDTRSINWVAILFVTVALPTALVPADDDRTGPTLLRAWFALGILLSLVAVLESLVESNPLAQYYNFDQHWALYRVTTTLGHPLMNGTFFAVTSCLAAFSALRRGSARGTAFTCFVLSALAAGLTGSRSGVYALVCGLGVGLLVMLVSGRTSIANKLLGIVIGVTALVVLPALPSIAGRANSAEGIASGLYRDQSVKLAGKLFSQSPWLGTGPGSSAIAVAQSGANLPLENAVLGTVVSVGVIGIAGLLVLVVLVLVRIVRGGRPDGIGAVSAFVAAGAAFPLWEPNPASLVLVGLVVIATRTVEPVLHPDVVTPTGVAEASRPPRLVPPRARPVPAGVR
jgi:hypothetical protein